MSQSSKLAPDDASLLTFLHKSKLSYQEIRRLIKTGRSKSSKSLVVASDIHDGSKVAICSDDVEIVDGSNYKPNKAQMALYKAWLYCVDSITQRPRALIINGEPIDGSNRSSMGAGIWSTNTVDQIRDFKKLVAPIKRDEIIFVRGSGYHVQVDGATPLEELVAESLEAKRYRTFQGSGFTDYECNIEMFGKVINFTHHVGFRRWFMYRPTAISIELAKMHFEHGKRGFHTDVMVRSHVHYYVGVDFVNTTGFSTPAWKFPDGFMYRHGIPTMPDVGMMEIIIEPNGDIDIQKHIVEVEMKPRLMHL